jgi:uncharacterized protein YodC (DUF2158 family)
MPEGEMKACPLCGAVHGAKTGGPKMMVSDSGHGWNVRCTGCLCRGPAHFHPDKALAAWNRRPAPIFQPADVEDAVFMPVTINAGGYVYISQGDVGLITMSRNGARKLAETILSAVGTIQSKEAGDAA